MIDALRQLEKLGMIPVSHDELVEFLEGYPWKLDKRINRAKQKSFAFWEPPTDGNPPILVAIKKLKNHFGQFDDTGYCFIVKDPNYLDKHGREWRRIDGDLCCLLATAKRRTPDGETFYEGELIALSGSNPKKFKYDERYRKLFYVCGLDGKKPPKIVRTKNGVDVK